MKSKDAFCDYCHLPSRLRLRCRRWPTIIRFLPRQFATPIFLARPIARKELNFFANYTQHPPLPETGPYVSMIQLETPFAVIVERTAQALNYNAPGRGSRV